MKPLSLSTPVKNLFMVGKTYAKRLEKLGINTAEDFLHHYPSRYQDYRIISKINQLQRGETVTVQSQIISFENIYTKYAKKLQKMLIADESGQLQVIFFNQPFLKNVLKPGLPISLSGKVDFFNRRISLISPEYELIKQPAASYQQPATGNWKLATGNWQLVTIHTGRLVPVYPETYCVSSKWLRSRIAPLLTKLLPKLSDWLPEKIRKYNKLIILSQALAQIHFPENKKQIKEAKNRLAFDELFLIQTQALLRKHAWQKNKTSYPLKVDQKKAKEFISGLPFDLTKDQQETTREILKDLNQAHPMNRLLQGDVGCGKTVVAAIAAYTAFLNGTQTALMAPTEILAFQHYKTLKSLFKPFGVKVGLATGSKKLARGVWQVADEKKVAKSHLPPDACDILIGTHALLYDKVNFQNLGLVIIDEQHRFGVEQRAKLIKKGQSPHILVMTATPIPRTVALSLYGDLDLSTIKEMPKGRKKIKTWVVPPEKRQAAYQWIKKQVKQEKIQAFIICPLIELSQTETLKNIKAVKEEFNKLSKKIFPDLKLGLLHGRLKAQQKEKIITAFRKKKTDILVATPVVEVGIDIPDAGIILIEAADRFGLATLHQLRGRVGRSNKQAYCLLFASEKKKAYSRLKLMESYNNGLELAEKDLKLRGPGELYGIAQHGFSKLKIASFNDLQLVEKVHRAANSLLKTTNYKLNSFPLLKEKLKDYTIRKVEPN